ncbi:hypothetical protein BEP19_00570 [Ammoniphilus oxalaticus]|uniref:Lipoprotein n=1 Tax=Ammoniphilus oxalaticus TaxID=66863 RepID=A0A419SRH3_9BACL|nr:hypothetical protein BEP19_00570 [Ammoniphilus oxalaticus]
MHNGFKLTLTGAIVFLGFSILVGSCQISSAINSTKDIDYQSEFNMFNYNLERLVELLEQNQ